MEVTKNESGLDSPPSDIRININIETGHYHNPAIGERLFSPSISSHCHYKHFINATGDDSSCNLNNYIDNRVSSATSLYGKLGREGVQRGRSICAY